jgi:hypothetical protein
VERTRKSRLGSGTLYSFIVTVLTGMVVLRPQTALAQVQRLKYPSGNQYLIVEFLDDDLVHFELSAFGPRPDVSEPVYTSPMSGAFWCSG